MSALPMPSPSGRVTASGVGIAGATVSLLLNGKVRYKAKTSAAGAYAVRLQKKKGTKVTTTVAMDFGRITVDDKLVMYLFGTPGQVESLLVKSICEWQRRRFKPCGGRLVFIRRRRCHQ